MANALTRPASRVTTLVVLTILLVFVAVVTVYSLRWRALYSQNSRNHYCLGHLYAMAQTLPKLDEAGIRAATPESLLGKPGGNVEFGGKLSLKLDGRPPHWAGTHMTCERDGEVVATLTLTSLRDGQWDADVKHQPEWWELWK